PDHCSHQLLSLPASFYLSSAAPPPTPLSPLPLHDALPISPEHRRPGGAGRPERGQKRQGGQKAAPPQVPGHLLREPDRQGPGRPDRKSTRLNSSHVSISYAVFCLKKKKKNRAWQKDSQHTA